MQRTQIMQGITQIKQNSSQRNYYAKNSAEIMLITHYFAKNSAEIMLLVIQVTHHEINNAYSTKLRKNYANHAK